ncbi:glycoside hydrolase family 108 protein [Sphingomonas panni]|uniref:glycoside hydrolase family 108 protein n=1 Tax=Sphingomonas panni TaxID=237612 RepID=UPI001F5BE289|nr:glycosyl hydrolase 108 family protein [Sphingomonas panni]
MSGLPNIDALVAEVIDREGGYVNHPADRGGPTRFGITERVARGFGYAGSMQSLPMTTAAVIYRRIYWIDPRFDEVGKRYPALAAELFDIGVNMGPAVAVTFLQRVLNVYNAGGTYYPDLAVDGHLGAMTLRALDSFRQRRGEAGGNVLSASVWALRGARYIEICEARPSQEAFAYGWIDRMVGTLKAWVGRG